MTPAERAFAPVSDALLREPDTALGSSGFGAGPAVRVGGRIAAMLVRERLVVKLPAVRCGELVDGATVEPLNMGARTMREWVSVGVEREDAWVDLAQEALAFVRGGLA